MWTSSRSSRAGAATSAPGRPNTKTANSTAAAPPTPATPATPALPQCRNSSARTCRTRASWAWSGAAGVVVWVDSGGGNCEQLGLTTSLRGRASGTLKVEILSEGVHSGDASGLVPSSLRIMRQVLDRLEDSATGRL